MPAIGIDIGGSKIALAVTDRADILHIEKYPFTHRDDPHGLTGFLADKIKRLCAQLSIDHAGVGTPGWVVDGIVREAVNLGIGEYDLQGHLRRQVPIPVYVENDARTALLGEARCGTLSGSRNAMMVTLGTGIGGAFWLDGRLYRGSFGCAGEIGHVSTSPKGALCSCGKRGCLEKTVSAAALVRRAAALARRSDGPLHRLCNGQPLRVDGEMIFRAAAQGDPAVARLLDRYIDELAHPLLETAYLLDLDAIAVGGGISAQHDMLIDPLRRRFAASGTRCRIDAAVLGNHAGLVGAALLGQEDMS